MVGFLFEILLLYSLGKYNKSLVEKSGIGVDLKFLSIISFHEDLCVFSEGNSLKASFRPCSEN